MLPIECVRGEVCNYKISCARGWNGVVGRCGCGYGYIVVKTRKINANAKTEKKRGKGKREIIQSKDTKINIESTENKTQTRKRIGSKRKEYAGGCEKPHNPKLPVGLGFLRFGFQPRPFSTVRATIRVGLSSIDSLEQLSVSVSITFHIPLTVSLILLIFVVLTRTSSSIDCT